jgi:hypothetical protein
MRPVPPEEAPWVRLVNKGVGPVRWLLILAIVSASLLVCDYWSAYLAVYTGPESQYKTLTYGSSMVPWEEYCSARGASWPVWRVRLFANWSAWPWVRQAEDTEEFTKAIAYHHAFWLGLAFLVATLWARRPLLWIVGIFAATQYAWTPFARGLLFPWDAPALAFWTAAVLMESRPGLRPWLLLLVPIGVGFKETIALAALFPLFRTDQPFKGRVRDVGVLILGCMAVRLGITAAVTGNVFSSTLSTHFLGVSTTGHHWFLTHNLEALGKIGPWLTSGGMMAALFLLPGARHRAIGGIFFASLMLFGVIGEYRLTQEMIPLFLMAYQTTQGGEK